jgi:hypothetical protein
MSQYPSPYQSPSYPSGYPYPQYPETNAPARQAGLLMICLGGLVFLMGGCFTVFGATLPSLKQQMPPDQLQMFQDLETKAHLTQGILIAVGIFLIVVSVLHVVVGVFVRGGRLPSLITAVVITSLMLLWLMLNVVSSLFQGAGAIVGMCFGLLLVGLFGWLLVLLIQAIRSGNQSRESQVQYQQQYLMYQQAMQQYGQPSHGYGYSYPAPPPPPDANDKPPTQ